MLILGTRPLRSAVAEDRFILSGEEDVFEPRMTFHGSAMRRSRDSPVG